jgi:D-3-phosphoglycerate dehydrogenase
MKVGFVDSVHPVLWEELDKLNCTCIDFTNLKHNEILPLVTDLEGIVIRSKFKITEEFLQLCPKLKFVARSGSGLENIDLQAAAKHNVTVINSPEGNKNAVAEHLIGMLLLLLNGLKKADTEVRNKIWQREANRGIELGSLTFGIIGYGIVGQCVAQTLKGFGCKVLAYDKYKTNYSDEFTQEVSWEQFCKQVDVVSLHVNYLPQNHHMANEQFFDAFAKPIYFINTARGNCLKTDDLVTAIKNKKVIGACLDVLEFEKIDFENELNSPVLNELFSLENVVFSPHVAGWTTQSYYKLSWYLAEKIKNYFFK